LRLWLEAKLMAGKIFWIAVIANFARRKDDLNMVCKHPQVS